MVSAEQWINDLTGSFILFFGITMGIILIFRSKESKAKIVFYFGLTCFTIGLIYLIFFLRFLSYFFPLGILYTQFPPFDSYVYVSLTTYGWIGPAVTGATYIGTELLIRRKYRIFFHVPAWILLIAWEILIFLGPSSYFNPITETDILGDTSFRFFSPPFFLMIFYALFLAIFLVIGFLLRAIRSGGVLEEKFVILSIGIFLIILELVFEGIQDVGKSIAFVLVLRILMIVGLFLVHYGLTPSRKKKENLKLPREVANLAYYVIGETEELDEQFWDLYIKKSKEIIDDYKEEKKKTTTQK